MPNLYVRGVPDDLYRALVRGARERDSTIAAETIRLLRNALAFEGPDQARLIEEIRANREPVRSGGPEAAALIRQGRKQASR